MERDLWRGRFEEQSPPEFPCPACGKGRLAPAAGPQIVERGISRRVQQEDVWEPDWLSNRFMLAMQCGRAECQEVVVLAGDTAHVELFDQDTGETDYSTEFIVKSVHPPLPMIVLPEKIPDDIAETINAAFGLYWLDKAAAAARLRSSVELILDTLGIARQATTGPLTLYKRIELLKTSDADNAESMDALRLVGNVGAHEPEVDTEFLLDVFEVLEHAVEKVYGGRDGRIAALRSKIIQAKGKPQI